MIETSIVILNYNGEKFLKQFLPKVIEYSKGCRVIVADNASKDNSIQIMKDEFPEVELIILDKNHGFCGGYNRALAQIDSKYFVLLNSDVEVTPNWTKAPVELLESDRKIAACQPKVLSYSQKDHFEYAGAAGGFMDKYGYPFCRGRIFDHLELDEGQYNENEEVFWATGAALFIRAELFKSVGGLDELFFAHMEEIDLCWRLKNLGHSIYYCGKSTVYHVGGGTLAKSSPRKTFYNFRNNLMLLYKNLPRNQKVKTLFIRLILDGLAGIYFLIKLDPKHTLAIIKAHFDFYFKASKLEKTKLKNEIKHGVLQKSIVNLYFVKNTKSFDKIKAYIS